MSRILVLGRTGFGKTTSYSGRKKFGIKGLDSKETFVIQCTNRGIANPNFKLVPPKVENLIKGNRMQVSQISGLDRFKKVAELVEALSVPESPFKNIVVDDFNYLAQDYYMANSMKGGWDTPKQIGYGMGIIFDAFESVPENKNLIVLAHFQEYKDKIGDSLSYKFKSTGNMVDDYITPEGKFDLVLYGRSGWDEQSKTAIKEYVTDFDGTYPAKDSLGVLDEAPLYIPNDLGLVVDYIDKHYGIK